MRVFKTRWFARFAKREDIGDDRLADAIARAERGLIDADLGGGLIKQRVARPGKGKSGGYRTLIAYRSGHYALLLFAFAKNERDNLDPNQLAILKDTAAEILRRGDDYIAGELEEGRLQEVPYGNEG
jgi:hypothetical protein